ncbi:MAG: VWA domain-containing protein, partial [Shimia sp.]|nr:VWA domain-containing protein [Shimia sp.]
MFLRFFENLRAARVPVSLREYLGFLEALKAGLATYDIDAFYYLGRTIMVKDERNIDKYDRAFATT